MGDCFTPIDICTMQFDRLDCDGTILAGADDRVITCNGVTLTWTPQLLAAKRDVSRNGARGICAQREIPAAVEGYNLALTFCPRIDVELYELLSVYDLVVDTAGVTGGLIGDNVGVKDGAASQPCACPTGDCQNAGVSILVWGNSTNADGISTVKPFAIGAFTRVKFDPPTLGLQDTYQNITLNGQTSPNPSWVRGPANIYPEIAGLDGAWALWNTIQEPPEGCACEACGYALVS